MRMLPFAADDQLPPPGLVFSFDVTRTVNVRNLDQVVTRYKVKFTNQSEAKRIHAEWRGMIGAKAAAMQMDNGKGGDGVTVIIEAALVPGGACGSDDAPHLLPPG